MRHLKPWLATGITVTLLIMSGCGKKSEERSAESNTGSPAQSTTSARSESTPPSTPTVAQNKTTEPMPPMDMAQLAAKNTETLKAMNQGKDIEPISLDTLKNLLPETLAGMKQTSRDAERVNMMGINVASANARYQTDGGDAELEVEITDVGNVSGPMRMGLTGWALRQYERQTDTGYEKTTTYEGCKAVEEYDRQDQQGTLRIFVSDRFIVEVTGTQTTMDTIKEAMKQIDIKAIKALASGS